MKLIYRIADLTVEMDSFGRTAEQAKRYLMSGLQDVDISIVSGWKGFKEKYPAISDDECEYYCTAYRFYSQLVNYDGFMLHSSAVLLDGKAYLFSAPCGTGKSTHTKLWLDVFGDRASILNDDKPALRRVNGNWYAYGTPWSGKHDISMNTRAPIGGICVLRRGKVNKIEPYRGARAITDIFMQTPTSKKADYINKLMDILDKLLTEVPIWRMECNMDPEAARMAYEAMAGRKDI